MPSKEIKLLSKVELQQQLKKLKKSTTGSKAQLVKRLETAVQDIEIDIPDKKNNKEQKSKKKKKT